MAVCTTGAERASESAHISGPIFQIIQAILRTLKDSPQRPLIAMGSVTAADSISREVKRKQRCTTEDAALKGVCRQYAED
jgi:hypothetical protein